MMTELKQRVYEQNLALAKSGLVVLTWGNVSAIDREKGLVVIKPSGIPYDKLTVEDMVVVDFITRKAVNKKLRPSSDLMTHLYLYDAFPEINAVVHTHSPNATAWAQAGEGIPAYGTTHSDTFYGSVPCTRAMLKEEVENNYEWNTGRVIAETFKSLDYKAIPAVLVKNHGPFTWGATPEEAVANAITLEEVAKMAIATRQIKADTPVIDSLLLDKHYFRKHGKNATYGQK